MRRIDAADDLRPELRIAAPADPVDAPAVLDVGGPRDRRAGAVAPAREDRLAEVGDQDRLRRRLGLRRDVAVQRRRVLDARALDRLDLLGDAHVDEVLDELALLRLLRLLHEDLRQRADVLDHVEAAVAGVGDHREQVAIGALHADARHRDARRAHVLTSSAMPSVGASPSDSRMTCFTFALMPWRISNASLRPG